MRKHSVSVPAMKRWILPLVAASLALPSALCAQGILVPFGAGNLRYNLLGSAPLPEFLGYNLNDSSWPLGQAPFGIGGAECVSTPAIVTSWPADKWLIVRFRVNLIGSTSTLDYSIRAACNYQLWVNGAPITAGSQNVRCPDLGSSSGSINGPPLVAGENLVALACSKVILDRTYLDFQISSAPTAIEPTNWSRVKALYDAPR